MKCIVEWIFHLVCQLIPLALGSGTCWAGCSRHHIDWKLSSYTGAMDCTFCMDLLLCGEVCVWLFTFQVHVMFSCHVLLIGYLFGQ
jgi:hypothetical protein